MNGRNQKSRPKTYPSKTALSVGHWEATHPTKHSKHSHKRSPWKSPRERTQEAPKPADAAHVERSGVGHRTVRHDQPDGPVLSRPRGQRHSTAPGRKRQTVRRRAPDGPTNVGQQGPSTAKQALTQTQASDGPACDAGRSGVRRMVQRITPDSPACTKTRGQARDSLLGKPNPTKLHQMNPNLPQTLKTPNRVC